MATPPLEEHVLLEAINALNVYGSKKAAAEALGMKYRTFQSRIDIARGRGLHLSQGVQQTIQRARLHPGEAKGGWKHVYDNDGNKVETVRWCVDSSEAQDIATQLADLFSSVEPAKPVISQVDTIADLCTLYPLMDVHLGMLAWGRETGAEDYNLEVAGDDMHHAFAQLSELTPASQSAILVIGGDFFHADDNRAETPASKHSLDVDGRHWKVMESGVRLIASVIERLLHKHETLILRVLRGNHDEHAHMVLTFALTERYREEPRVEVEKTPRDIFMRQWGRCLIAAHHGDRAKPDQLAMMLADVCPFWSETRHRFIFTGHIHHDRARDVPGGIKWESLRAFCPPDSYAAGMGYTSRRAMQALTFHKQRGLILRALDPIERAA